MGVILSGLVYCLPDPPIDKCECTPEYEKCPEETEEYGDYEHYCNEENEDIKFYTEKCCMPKIYLIPGYVGNNPHDGKVIWKKCILEINVCFTYLLIVHFLNHINI